MKKFYKILKYIFPYWKNASVNMIFILLSVIFGLFSFTMAIPFLGILFENQELITEKVVFEFNLESMQHNFNYYLSQIIIEKGAKAALVFVSIIMVIFVLLKTSFLYFGKYIMAPLRNGVVKDIRNKIYNKILNLQLSYFSDEKKGDIMSRITNDVQEIEVSIIRSIDVLFQVPITIIIYIVALFVMSFELTLFVLILLPVTGYLIGRIGKSLRKKSFRAQTKMGVLLTIIEETLSGLRIIKAFNAEKKSKKKFEDENHDYTKIMISMWRRRDLAVPLSEFLGTIVIVILMWYGGSMVLNNQSSLSSQEFIGFIIIFSQIINPAKALTSAFYNIQKGMASSERIEKILEAETTIVEKENPLEIKEFKSSIVYKNVHFRYDTENVLKNINLTIEKGKTIALVGQSGSGKSTLVDLLARFYDVSKGDILIDGQSIKDYKIVDLRNLMGNVNQESILFNDTIFNNISFSFENASSEQVISAAKVANAHNFIETTENSYMSNIGDRGNKLSGGQKQRISIARAVLKNPPILILDEATSALDTESERLVQDALTNLMKNRTSIVIAHRLSTVQFADEICVLHQGEIVERGKHKDLIQLNGNYKKLHDLQMFS
ncbi:MAG: ABC transporter ATP-binding protein [Bacteroidetes bacterium]|jgi:ATP-binding cassette, subfamily B, bacterial MsbA|nr:ABC transporter ATP-binding protein [Bacteroidota bacterium]MBT6687926.1 ABC transporter ATP-binding protein [Bacteroidota bacterium]MBT7143265.1 ABC transporter ATP-binding protein [Bacteroidota bacterium]MBT7490246.1 ABC transporter ATP-binding protein [Bacteroidota bacterium]